MTAFASNCLPQARTKQIINVRQPNLPEKRVMPSPSLVALRFARHARGSSSAARQVDQAIVDPALVQQHTRVHRSCTGECEHAGQTQLLSPIPVSPPLTLFCKGPQLQYNCVAQPRARLGKGEQNGSNVLGCGYSRTSQGQGIRYLGRMEQTSSVG